MQFLTQTGEAEKLTDQLTSIIRQQRHLATRVILATQEPTLAPQLIDLCNVCIVHRFNSPAWFRDLHAHLAGVHLEQEHTKAELFELIVGLQTGEALIFCPSALLDVRQNDVHRVKDSFVRVRIRNRVTADGGRSIMASDEVMCLRPQLLPVEELIRPFAAPGNPTTHKPAKAAAAPNVGTNLEARISTPIAGRSTQALLANSMNPSAQSDAATPGSVRRSARIAQTPRVSVAISHDEAKAVIRRVVTEHLLQKNGSRLRYDSLRRMAAQEADLPQHFFVSNKEWVKFSRVCIQAEVVGSLFVSWKEWFSSDEIVSADRVL